MHLCIQSELLAYPKVDTLQTLQVLVSSGAKWDAKCDKIVASHEARQVALALRMCVLLWIQEFADGLPFTEVPVEVIKRGQVNTQTHIDALKNSTQIVFRGKVCLVGSSCAGKTSLAKSITTKQPHLVHLDDRTIGIDHVPLRFLEASTGNEKTKIHEVTFWDFAGQDAYQVAHSLFFSPRTLFLVCVDHEAFMISYMQAVIFANEDFQETRLLDEFVEQSVMRWVHMIVARQPDAEFVFIATKEDVLADNRAIERILKESLVTKLTEVVTTVQQMKERVEKNKRPVERSKLPVDDTTIGPAELLKKVGATFQWMTGQLKAEQECNPECPVSVIKPTVVYVSCTSLASIQVTRTEIEALITNSGYSFQMPDTYTRVLKESVRIREAAKTSNTSNRIIQVFAPMKSLPAKLKIEPKVCRIILQTLHDLGDVLWYEDLGVKLFWNTVILDPLLLIDFIRQIFNHKNTGQILRHTVLRELPFWMALDNDKQIEAMKQVLQAFHLVYSNDEYGVMEWNSDLIVPAFWQTKMRAAWVFGGDILRINKTLSCEGEAVRVHWEYHFEFGLPMPLFDHVVVATVSTHLKFDTGPDWIMYKEKEIAACRLVVGRNAKTLHRSIHVEAVVAEAATVAQAHKLWQCFRQLLGAFVKVLRENQGLQVSSFAWDDDLDKPTLKSLLWSPTTPSGEKWMPPVETWNWFKRLMTEQGHSQSIEADWESY